VRFLQQSCKRTDDSAAHLCQWHPFFFPDTLILTPATTDSEQPETFYFSPNVHFCARKRGCSTKRGGTLFWSFSALLINHTTPPKTSLIACNQGSSKQNTHVCARKLTPPQRHTHFCARKRACPNPRKMKKYEICEILFPCSRTRPIPIPSGRLYTHPSTLTSPTSHAPLNCSADPIAGSSDRNWSK